MEEEEELLQYIYKSADMGCEGIRTVLDYVEDEKLKKTLREQLGTYQNLEQEAGRLLE